MSAILRIVLVAAVLAWALVLIAPASSSAWAGPCDCYYDSDCPDPAKQTCNWQSACARHCKPAANPPGIKGATPDCDGDPENDGPGPCVDKVPQPPEGTNGNDVNCEPVDATEGRKYKMQDGTCTWNKNNCPQVPPDNLFQNLRHWGNAFMGAGLNGGGEPLASEIALANSQVTQLGCQNDARDVALNMATMCLGNKFLQPDMTHPNGFVQDLTGSQNACARTVLDACALGLADEVLQPGCGAVATRLAAVDPSCLPYVDGVSAHCEFPHPVEHGHDFDFADGGDCIAHQLGSAARSLTVRVDVPVLTGAGVAVLAVSMAAAAAILLVRRRRTSNAGG